MSRDNSRVDQDRDSEEIHENFRDLYEEYHAEWTDSFHLPPADRRTIVKTIDNKVHEWHGIEWSVVCAVEPNQVGLFLGIDPSHKHPRKFERKLKFGFVFINSNGDCIAEGVVTLHYPLHSHCKVISSCISYLI